VAEQLKQITKKRESLLSAARVNEDGISLYAEGETRRSISTMNLRAALQTFLELRNPDSYIADRILFSIDAGVHRNVSRPARWHAQCARNACSGVYGAALSACFGLDV
jgi:hypothetical protein